MTTTATLLTLHSPEQVEGILDDARRIVTELELHDDLKGLAFGKAVDLLAARHVLPVENGLPHLAIPVRK